MILNIAGGVALLLWGARMVRTGVIRAYGGDLRRILGRSTRNRLVAFVTGLGIAGAVHSSIATALLAVAFASKGLLTTAPGLAIMLGLTWAPHWRCKSCRSISPGWCRH